MARRGKLRRNVSLAREEEEWARNHANFSEFVRKAVQTQMANGAEVNTMASQRCLVMSEQEFDKELEAFILKEKGTDRDVCQYMAAYRSQRAHLKKKYRAAELIRQKGITDPLQIDYLAEIIAKDIHSK